MRGRREGGLEAEARAVPRGLCEVVTQHRCSQCGREYVWGGRRGRHPGELTEAPPRCQSAGPEGNCSAVSAVGAGDGAQPHREQPQTPSFPKVQPEPLDPFSAPRALARTAPTPPGSLRREGPGLLALTVPGTAPPLRQPRYGFKGWLLLRFRDGVSHSLSLAQGKMVTQNQLEAPPPVFSGFHTGSPLPIVRHNRTAPTRPRSGELRVKEKKTEKGPRGAQERVEGDETPCP